jgi:hypothetical protein
VIFFRRRKGLLYWARKNIEQFLLWYRNASTGRLDVQKSVVARQSGFRRTILTTHPTPFTNFHRYSTISSPRKYRDLRSVWQLSTLPLEKIRTHALNWCFLYKKSEASTPHPALFLIVGQSRTTVGLSQFPQSISATTLASSDSAGRWILDTCRRCEILVVVIW